MEPFIGQIQLFGFNFAPRGWAFCEGQLLAISQYTALFSLLGTTYGGDGRTTFGLPDLRGRVPIGPGTGPGLSTYRWGQKGGQERVTLNINEIPSHTHTMMATTVAGSSSNPSGMLLAETGALDKEYGTGALTAMNNQAIGQMGGNQPHNILQPYLAVYYCIALVGVFPSRS